MVNPFDPRTILLAKHAQHVVLIHFPIALFITGVGLDLLSRGKRDSQFASAAYQPVHCCGDCNSRSFNGPARLAARSGWQEAQRSLALARHRGVNLHGAGNRVMVDPPADTQIGIVASPGFADSRRTTRGRRYRTHGTSRRLLKRGQSISYRPSGTQRNCTRLRNNF